MSERKWKTEVKEIKKKELQYCCLMVAIVAIGIGSEFLAKSGRSIFYVLNYDEVSLVLIQVQATLFTLTIALVALLGGRITNEFLGVKYNNFILNIKPCYLTQKRIISLSLLLLVVNFFLHMFGCYNLVVAIFVVTVFLVGYSASLVYGAFVGTELIDEEICVFVDDALLNENTQVNVFNSFCEQWLRECTVQETGDYEKYLRVFNKGFLVLVKTDATRKILLDRCIALSKLLLKKADTAVRGIAFINECYDNAWVFVREYRSDSGINVSSPKVSFYLFENIYFELREAIINMKVKDAEKSFRWHSLTNHILQVDLYLGYNNENPEQNYELDYLQEFGGLMGYYISPKCNVESAAERSDEYWGGSLTQLYTYYSFPDNLQGEAERVMANVYFCFMISQIKYDNAVLVKEYLYTRALSSHHKVHQPYILMFLKYHCYLYYLAEFETLDCINQDLKKRAKSFLEDEKVVKAFSQFIISAAERDKNVFDFGVSDLELFNDKLIDKLEKELRSLESYPKNGNAKILLMEQVARQFVLFMVLYISNYYHVPELLDKVISEEQATIYYINYIRDNDHTAELKRFLKFVGVSDDCIEDQADSFYTSLVECIKKQYKYYSIHEAEKSEKVLDRELAEKKDVFTTKIKEYLEESFKGIIVDNQGESCKASLMVVSGFSDQQLDSFLDGRYDLFFNRFVYVIANKLYRESKINTISRKSFDTDEDLLEYINSHKDSVIIGSEFILRPMDFRHRENFIEAIHEAEYYTTGAHGLALLLNKNSLKISITKIRVGTHIPAIYETDAKYDKDTSIYSFEVSHNMTIDFTEEELKNYLKNKRRIVNIVVHFTIETANGIIGDVVQD